MSTFVDHPHIPIVKSFVIVCPLPFQTLQTSNFTFMKSFDHFQSRWKKMPNIVLLLRFVAVLLQVVTNTFTPWDASYSGQVTRRRDVGFNFTTLYGKHVELFYH
eukprot:PhF_6_TR22235/c0_g1_i1/m.31403